jgi:peptidoglycan/xylan/chitin deacetylase (PgdA/CDA1 family)
MALTRGQFLRSLGGSIGNAAANLGMAAATRLLEGGSAMLESRSADAPAAPDLPFHRQGPSTGNRIALTFDDGPTPGVTELILDELARRHARATFFMIGEKAAASPDLVRRVAAEGHEIGNHTYTHVKLTQLPDAGVAAELARTQETIRQITGHAPRLLRPPFGELRKNQSPLVRNAGLQVALWSIDSRDWSHPATSESVSHVIKYLQSGAIILFHDLTPATGHVIPSLMDAVDEKGLSPMTVSNLLNLD